MAEKFSDIYYPGMTPEELADNVLKNAYGDGTPYCKPAGITMDSC